MLKYLYISWQLLLAPLIIGPCVQIQRKFEINTKEKKKSPQFLRFYFFQLDNTLSFSSFSIIIVTKSNFLLPLFLTFIVFPFTLAGLLWIQTTKRLKITIFFFYKKIFVKRNKNLHEFNYNFFNTAIDRRIFCICMRKMFKFIDACICFNLACSFSSSSVSTYRHLDL